METKETGKPWCHAQHFIKLRNLMAYTYNPFGRKKQEVLGHPQLQDKSQIRLRYIRPCSKNNNNKR